MSLAQKYCKEILRETEQIPVYPPGTQLNPGDILKFTNSRRPLGSFQIMGNLTQLGVPFQELPEPEANAKTFTFTSKKGVGFSFEAEANVPGAQGGELKVSFDQEGASFVKGRSLKTYRIDNLFALEQAMKEVRGARDWGNYYIVTAVIRADKALAMQSAKVGASLTLAGDVKGLEAANVEIGAQAEIGVTSSKDAAFLIDWTPDVPLFVKLMKYRPRRDSFRYEAFDPDDAYELQQVHPEDLLEEGAD